MSRIEDMMGLSLDDIFDEDSSDVDFLLETPLTVIENCIETQFDEPLEYRKKDYIRDFLVKYEAVKNDEIENDIQEADELSNEFMTFIKRIFKERLNIGFNGIDDKNENYQYDIIHYTYRFFIRNIKKNFFNIIRNVMESQIGEIINRISPKKQKNVTYMTFKSEIDDERKIIILSNTGKAIEIIFDMIKDYDVDTFFEMCDSGEADSDLERIKDYFDDYIVTGNFVHKYIDMIDFDFKIDLEMKLRSHILKEFPNRKIRQEIKKDLDKVSEEEVKENNGEVSDEKN